MTLRDDISQTTTPASVTIAAGASSATFTVSAASVSRQRTSNLQATLNPTSAATVATNTVTYALTINPLPMPTSLTCSPTSLYNGQSTRCTVTMAAVSPKDMTITTSSSSSALTVPANVLIRTGQIAIDFMAQAVLSRNVSVTITARANSGSAKATVSVIAGTAPTLTISGVRMSTNGEPVRLSVSGADSEGLSAAVSSVELPAGASFEPNSGEFSWTPVNVPDGDYTAIFQAVNGLGQTGQSKAVIRIESGSPSIEKLLHSATRLEQDACSPGSLATVIGKGLSTSGNGDQTLILINGETATVTSHTGNEITFQCPALPAGTPLEIQARRGSLFSNAIKAGMAAAAPGIFSLEGSGRGQGLVQLDELQRIAALRFPDESGQPATATDRIAIVATGLGENPQVEALIGERLLPVESLVASEPGVWRVVIKLPTDTPVNDTVNLGLILHLPDGSTLKSNVVTFATEARNVE